MTNKTGHKFPSGVGFRRAFVDFAVLDEAGAVLWESGRTRKSGVLIDQAGAPIGGTVRPADHELPVGLRHSEG
jgi:hypothetical protein